MVDLFSGGVEVREVIFVILRWGWQDRENTMALQVKSLSTKWIFLELVADWYLITAAERVQIFAINT